MSEYMIHNMRIRAKARIELLEELLDGFATAGLEAQEMWVLSYFGMALMAERDEYRQNFGDK